MLRSQRPPALILVAAAALAAGGCKVFPDHPVDVDHPTVTTDSGVRYTDQLAGVGPPAREGDTVTIHYVAWLEDGTQVDSSRDRGLPVTFVLGQASLPGWDAGVQGMHAGGVRRMSVPAELGYGEAGVPGLVPPDAMLVFEVDLLRIGEE